MVDRLAKARAAKALKAEQRAAEARRTDVDANGEPLTRASALPKEPDRTPPRQAATRGRGEVVGRNGEVLSRTRTQVGDAFDVPKGMIPEGWEYQWNVHSVVGDADIVRDQSMMMHSNGWRPVPAERHAGVLVEPGSAGVILRGGLRLDERPKSLSDDARAEDISNAKQLISDRNESLKLGAVKNAMQNGYEMGGRYKGTGGDIRMSIDRALDIPAPQHTLVKPGE